VIKRHGCDELESVTRRSFTTPALAGSSAIGNPSVESMRRLDFMRVIIVLASFAFFVSQKDASIKARSTSHSMPLTRVIACASRS